MLETLLKNLVFHDTINMKVLLCFLCLCVLVCFGDECKKVEVGDDVVIESSSSCTTDFQLKYPGYQMEVEIQELTLDSSDGSYLSFVPEHDEKEYKFVWSQEEPKKFIITQSKVKITFYTTKTGSKFKILLRRHGDLTTTTSSTTVVTFPTPGDNDTMYYTVNISVSATEFVKQELAFKQVLVNMTEQYCQEEDILLSENVTVRNIVLQQVTQCPTSWPAHATCTQVRLAVPVLLANSSRYELRACHLQRMWDRLAAHTLPWPPYTAPDSGHDLLLWLVPSLLVLAAFFVMLFFVRAFGLRFGGKIKRRASDTEQIIATPKRVSDASLWPTSTQSIPPLFDSENAYIYFEPDTTIRASQSHHQRQHVPDSRIMNVDELSSDEEILNSNSTRTNYNPSVLHLGHDAHNKESAL